MVDTIGYSTQPASYLIFLETPDTLPNKSLLTTKQTNSYQPVPSVPVFSIVPVVPKSPVPPIMPARAIPPVELVPVFSALVPRPPVTEPKLNPAWGLFCVPNKLSVVSDPRPAKKTERHHCGCVLTSLPLISWTFAFHVTKC